MMRAISDRISIRRIRRTLIWLFEARSSVAAVGHTLIARFGVLAINLGTGLIIARKLAPRGRGEQAAMTLWPTVICGLLTFGLPVALRYYAARDRARSAEFLSVALLYSTVLGFVGILAGVIFIPHWLSNYDIRVIRFAQWLMLLAPATMLAWMLQSFLEARGDFRQSNAIVYIPPATTLVGLLVLLAFHHLTPYTSSLAYALPPVLLMVWRLIALRQFIHIPKAGFRDATRLLLGYGLGAYGINVLNTFSSQIDQALIIKFLSAADLGAYTVALTVARLPGLMGQSVAVVLVPRASALEPDAALVLVARAARLTFAATAAGAAILALIVPKALPFLYGHPFAVSVGITQILFFQVALGSTNFVLAQGFLAVGRPTLLTALQVLGLATTVPLMLTLIPRFGLKGAALALLCSGVLRMTLLMASYPVVLKRSPPNLILRPADVRYVIAMLRAQRRSPANVNG